MKKIILMMALTAFSGWANAQLEQLLYPDGNVPYSKHTRDKESTVVNEQGINIVSKVTLPKYIPYIPKGDNKQKTAVIVCPGGGYAILASSHEGTDVAKKLMEHGIAAFVLKYRLPDDSAMTDKAYVPLADAQAMLKTIRENAAKWGIDTGKIGVMGFSAGGHLAATLSTHFDTSLIDNPGHISLRPDFSVLLYPVISMEKSLTHGGSRDNLLGTSADEEDVHYFSNEERVNAQTPLAFLVHAADDGTVNPENSIRYFEALQKMGVKGSALHIWPYGGHGFGMHLPNKKDQWMDLLFNWLEDRK